ncbi:MarR family transcriptional regulator [Herbihabitans rhizosphaerae]|uniref:MarR family transcriptional regulator n=1 Tax=Herbihabitans rhizosphaerae TaxID=1872711 RepID=A0A4Q7L6A1_9PSEU|nr:MarR family winged helix-turn-helix transcriptional regulator [Herbihabitans rhizosphaerae]RZS44380.1 MarR family transcriptional regulator [Herbihabitans rhizosphaerae]
MAEPRWLDEDEARAWRGYRRMFLLLNARIARELAEECGLSEPDYDVLSMLSDSKGRSERIKDLAARMLWSQSRLSHHITRMQQRGLVTREEVAGDRRGASVVLTKTGLKAIRTAAPSHVESVRRNIIDLLTPEQVTVLGDIAETVVERLATDSTSDRGTGARPG